MPLIAYIDPGTTGLLAQFAAAGFAGVFLYLRSRFRRDKKVEPPAPTHEESVKDQA